MKTQRLTFHTDPGHGWLEVTRADLVELGILGLISPYSYTDGPRFYLEEDCDATLYLEAAKAAGWVLHLVDKYAENSFVRQLPGVRVPA
jgi:hypothetical protein